jgi:hypothetical protein
LLPGSLNVGHHDVRAFRRQTHRHILTDPAGRAGDYRDLVF